MAGKQYQKAEKSLNSKQINKRLLMLFGLFLICLVVIVPPTLFNKAVDSINSKAHVGIPHLPSKSFNFGLDLQGGAHLVYQAKTAQIPAADVAGAVDGVRDVIERRVRGGLGVAEPLVQTTKVGNDYRIIVELPGVNNVNQAIKMIGETPILEFKEENAEPPRSLTDAEKKQLNDFNKAAEKKSVTALQALKKGMNFDEAVTKYSDDEAAKKSGGDLGFIAYKQSPEFYDWANTHKNGDITDKTIKTDTGLNIVKRLEERTKGDEKIVSAAHLLICYKGATRCDSTLYTKEEALKKIQEVKKEVTTKNFAELVKKYSTEADAKDREGDLGKIEKDDLNFIPALDKALFEQLKAGDISEPIETEYGFHLVYKKTEEPLKEYHLARVFIKTQKETDIVPPQSEWKTSGLSGKQLKRAEVVQDPRTGETQVSLNFNDEGTKLFAELTTRSINKKIAIFLDGSPISIAGVDEPILSGSAVIRGGSLNNLVAAKNLVKQLNLGALPVPVELLSQKKVDATLGIDSLNKSYHAGLIGLILIMIFMVIYYRLPGLLSVFSLAYYALLSLALFKLIGVTLTLSGIAGFILSIGMAVDANVLVFERLKEELKLGKSLRTGVEEAFARSWPSIRDGHITALISCAFLLWFGSGFVQGFAAVLAIGTLINLFTAITVTRTIMRFVCARFKSDRASWLFLGNRSKNNESTL